jgi:hypothetical protein
MLWKHSTSLFLVDLYCGHHSYRRGIAAGFFSHEWRNKVGITKCNQRIAAPVLRLRDIRHGRSDPWLEV